MSRMLYCLRLLYLCFSLLGSDDETRLPSNFERFTAR
ncbi:hypothetical protein AALP_AAs62749U000100 [Arabis alpina]|uniref:Uncharacterized protein n=1 Tax=Arabis alpina TaxID=50452 RepID=A0A087FXF3_ARAAL|nr:hypothetical protein AALP_AAs62749U000100 [Arabis alpina]